MEAEQPFASIYKPSHDERARQSFIGTMKGCLNGPTEKQLARRYEQVLKPRYGALHGGPPANRQQGCAAGLAGIGDTMQFVDVRHRKLHDRPCCRRYTSGVASGLESPCAPQTLS